MAGILRSQGNPLCRHCGHPLERLDLVEPTDAGQILRREALLAHPLYQQAMSLPPPSVGSTQRGIGIAIVVTGVVGGAAFLRSARGLGSEHDPVITFFALALVVWCLIGVGLIVNGRRHRTSPVQACPSTIVKAAPAAGTVKVRLRDGTQRYFAASAELAEAMVPDADGVAFVEGDQLRGFHRLDG